MKLTRYHNSPLANSFADLESLFNVSTSGVSPFFDFVNRVAHVANDPPRSNHALYEDDDAFYARFDLPGVKKEELSVDLNSRQLDLAVLHDVDQGDDTKREATWKRSFTVPEGIDSVKVNAKLEEAVLTIALPKAEASKPRSIAID